MQSRPLGASGIQASVVGLGTWAIGGWMWGGTDKEAAIRAIQAGIDEGIDLVDTAPIYGFGVSEEIVGEAIRGRRDKVVLATKCGLVWHEEAGDHFFNSDEKHPRGDAAERKVYRHLGKDSIIHEVEQSLRRLGVEAIDLYQTHWQDSTTPIAETMETLLALKEQGKIRAIGVSNAAPEQIDEYRVLGPIDSDQEKYSMLDRGHEQDLLPYCADNGVAYLAYSPLALGLLTGKIGPDRVFNEGDQRLNNPRFSAENRQRITDMLAGFQPVADAHGISLAQLVIAWTVHQRGCSHALVGARNPQQAQENARAGDVALSEEELTAMQACVEGLAASD